MKVMFWLKKRLRKLKPVTDDEWRAAAAYAMSDAELCKKRGNHRGWEVYTLEAHDYLSQIKHAK